MTGEPPALSRPAAWRAAAAVALAIAGGLGAAAHSQPQAPSAVPATAPTLLAAFAAAYPKPTVEISGQWVKFHPALIERVAPDAFALVCAGQALAAAGGGAPGHVTFGYAAIAYLKAEPTLALMAKPSLISMSRGGFGAPPTIQSLPGVSATPTIELVSSYGDQGIFDTAATLLALGPTPIRSSPWTRQNPIGHTNGPCDIDGKIVPVTSARRCCIGNYDTI